MSQAVSGADCWGQGFTIDTVANLTGISSQQCSSGTLSVTVNGNNQITTTGFSYDGAGNMTADGSGYTYAFDAENRITSATGMGGGPWNYLYDGNGLRVKKSNGAGGTLYWRSLSGDVIAETDLNGTTTNEYVFFAGRRISRVDASGNVFFYYADHLGTTRTITTGTGATCYDADFTPYGQEMVHTNTCPQNYKFTGYERDTETGLDYAMFRYYNPRLGRFMSHDPVGGDGSDPQTLNLYSYVRNAPGNWVDPEGLSPFPYVNPGFSWQIYIFELTFGLFSVSSEFGDSLSVTHYFLPLSFGDIPLEGTQQDDKECRGTARVIGPGKPGHGVFGPNDAGTIAVIPTQFNGGNGDPSTKAVNAATPPLMSYAGQVHGYVGAGLDQPIPGGIDESKVVVPVYFSGISDVVGGLSGRSSQRANYPNDLIIERNGGSDLGRQPVTIFVPGGAPCPQFSSEVK